jgi:hypothetical protein
MQVIEKKQDRLDAALFEESKHGVETGGAGIAGWPDRDIFRFEATQATEIVERLAEDAEWQGSFRGIAVAGTNGECGSGQLSGAVEQRRLSESRFAHEE